MQCVVGTMATYVKVENELRLALLGIFLVLGGTDVASENEPVATESPWEFVGKCTNKTASRSFNIFDWWYDGGHHLLQTMRDVPMAVSKKVLFGRVLIVFGYNFAVLLFIPSVSCIVDLFARVLPDALGCASIAGIAALLSRCMTNLWRVVRPKFCSIRRNKNITA